MIKYDNDIIKVLKLSELEAYKLNNKYLGTEHLILGILKYDNPIKNILISNDVNYNSFKKYIKKENEKISNIIYTPLLKKILINCESFESISLKDVILNLIELNEGIAISIFNLMKIDINKLYNSVKNQTQITYGINLNDVVKNNDNKIYGRDNQLKELIEALCKKNKNNVILLGDAGVGKTAIVEALAIKINNDDVPEELINKKIISITMSEIISGTRYRGEFEAKIENLIKEVINNDNIILFIDEIHTLVGAGGAEGAVDASNILKPYLARNSIKCIGATTNYEYNNTIAKDKALSRRFKTINILEPNLSETIDILKYIKPSFEKYHNIIINNKDIELLVKKSNSIQNLKNPDKSIEILDSICSKKKVNCDNKLLINDLIVVKNKLVKSGKYSEAISINKKLNNLKSKKIKLLTTDILNYFSNINCTSNIGFNVNLSK